MPKINGYILPSFCLFLGLTINIFYGCYYVVDCDCDDEINDLINNRGQTEEIDRCDSGDYHSHTYWYWCDGFSITFTWGGSAGCCETSIYTFSPICSSNTMLEFSEESNNESLLEIDGDEGKILVFPSIMEGPQKPVIKFVMFGIDEIPEVIIDTPNAAIQANITTITFLKGYRFSGWFEIPDDEIIRLWISDNFLPWEEWKIE